MRGIPTYNTQGDITHWLVEMELEEVETLDTFFAQIDSEVTSFGLDDICAEIYQMVQEQKS